QAVPLLELSSGRYVAGVDPRGRRIGPIQVSNVRARDARRKRDGVEKILRKIVRVCQGGNRRVAALSKLGVLERYTCLATRSLKLERLRRHEAGRGGSAGDRPVPALVALNAAAVDGARRDCAERGRANQ